MKDLTYAEFFHKIAQKDLTKLGFLLHEGPNVEKRFYGSGVIYKNGQGLYLMLGFNPNDGGDACAQFGRVWRYDGAEGDEPGLTPGSSLFYSNSYFAFAHTYGQYFLDELIQVGWRGTRKNYSTDDEWKKSVTRDVCESIFDPLLTTLPFILSQLNEADLLKIEGTGLNSVTVRVKRLNGIREKQGQGELSLVSSMVNWDENISRLR